MKSEGGSAIGTLGLSESRCECESSIGVVLGAAQNRISLTSGGFPLLRSRINHTVRGSLTTHHRDTATLPLISPPSLTSPGWTLHTLYMLTMASGTPPKIPRAVKLMETYASGLGAVKLASSVQALRLQVNRRPKRVGEG